MISVGLGAPPGRLIDVAPRVLEHFGVSNAV
jgi:hypothetical protein